MMASIVSGTEEDIETLDKLIIEFNLLHLPFPQNPPWKTLSFIYKNGGETLAGIYGHLIMNNVLSIRVLYVAEEIRHQGYGTRLLRTLENEAKKSNAYLSQLDTFDFQGLEFYEKNGYEIFGVLNDCPARGHKRYYLRKQL